MLNKRPQNQNIKAEATRLNIKTPPQLISDYYILLSDTLPGAFMSPALRAIIIDLDSLRLLSSLRLKKKKKKRKIIGQTHRFK